MFSKQGFAKITICNNLAIEDAYQSEPLSFAGLALEGAKKIKKVIPGFYAKKGKRGRPPKDHRLMVEAMIYFLRVGCPWRDLPTFFGSWNSVYTRWRRWALCGVWAKLLPILAKGARGKLRAVDATHIKVHQHGANPRGGQALHAIGRTKGGLNSKLHAVVDGKGRALALVLTAGQVHELRAAPQLLESLRKVILIGDKAYGSKDFARLVAERDSRICVPAKSNCRHPLPFHRGWYRKRHHVENFFQRAKALRRFATRYDKSASCFLATVCLAAVLDWIR